MSNENTPGERMETELYNTAISKPNDPLTPQQASDIAGSKRPVSPVDNDLISKDNTNSPSTSQQNRNVAVPNRSKRTARSSSSSLNNNIPSTSSSSHLPNTPQRKTIILDKPVYDNPHDPYDLLPNEDKQLDGNTIINPNTNNPYRQRTTPINSTKMEIDMDLYTRSTLHGAVIEACNIDGTNNIDKLEKLTEILAKCPYLFNIETITKNGSTYFVANFVSEEACHTYMNSTWGLSSHNRDVFHRYEGPKSIERLQHRKKLDKAARSVKIECIPRHITIKQLKTCIFHTYQTEIIDIKEIVNKY